MILSMRTDIFKNISANPTIQDYGLSVFNCLFCFYFLISQDDKVAETSLFHIFQYIYIYTWADIKLQYRNSILDLRKTTANQYQFNFHMD